MTKKQIADLKKLRKVSGGAVIAKNINAYGDVTVVDKSKLNQTDNSKTSSNTNTTTTIVKGSIFGF